MLLTNINASFRVGANLFNEQPNVNGAIEIQTSQSLDGLALDSLYSVIIPAATLVAASSSTYLYNNFPTVKLNGTLIAGDDKLQLTLNAIHGYSIQLVDATGATGVGTITATITHIGNALATPASHGMAVGDCLTCLTTKGWTGVSNSAIQITANTGVTLANCNIIFTIFGKASGSGSGYY